MSKRKDKIKFQSGQRWRSKSETQHPQFVISWVVPKHDSLCLDVMFHYQDGSKEQGWITPDDVKRGGYEVVPKDPDLKKFRVVVPVKLAKGNQIYIVEAKTAEEACENWKDGEWESEELEVQSLGDPKPEECEEIEGE